MILFQFQLLSGPFCNFPRQKLQIMIRDVEKIDLVSRENVTNALKLDKIGLEFISPWLYKLFGMEQANDFYHKHQGLPSHEFIDALFDDLNVKLDVSDEHLSLIPKEGPFWFISNHPLGIWDGLIIMKLIKQVRPEFKVITIFMLERMKELRPHIVPVNSWKDKQHMGGNHGSMKEIFRTLRIDKQPVGLFPGGSVSRYISKYGEITDPPWNPTAIKLMARFDIPIVPIYIHGRNTNFFYLLSLLSHTMRRGRNFAEFFNKNGRTIKVNVGKIIPVETWKQVGDENEISSFLRKKVYEMK